MSRHAPNFAENEEITREDLLRAMQKLSHIIDADKYGDEQDSSNQYYESPEKFNSGRKGQKSQEGDYIKEVK
jgi:hypothetical protein